MSLFYDFGGIRNEIKHSEVDAIERSGKSGSVFQYALCPPSQWNDGNWGQLRHVGERPGQTEPGTMPVETSEYKAPNSLIHWYVRDLNRDKGSARACACGVGQMSRSDNRFNIFVHSARACPRCVELFNEHNR